MSAPATSWDWLRAITADALADNSAAIPFVEYGDVGEPGSSTIGAWTIVSDDSETDPKLNDARAETCECSIEIAITEVVETLDGLGDATAAIVSSVRDALVRYAPGDLLHFSNGTSGERCRFQRFSIGPTATSHKSLGTAYATCVLMYPVLHYTRSYP